MDCIHIIIEFPLSGIVSHGYKSPYEACLPGPARLRAGRRLPGRAMHAAQFYGAGHRHPRHRRRLARHAAGAGVDHECLHAQLWRLPDGGRRAGRPLWPQARVLAGHGRIFRRRAGTVSRARHCVARRAARRPGPRLRHGPVERTGGASAGIRRRGPRARLQPDRHGLRRGPGLRPLPGRHLDHAHGLARHFCRHGRGRSGRPAGRRARHARIARPAGAGRRVARRADVYRRALFVYVWLAAGA